MERLTKAPTVVPKSDTERMNTNHPITVKGFDFVITAATISGILMSIAHTARHPKIEAQIFLSGDSGIRIKNSLDVSSSSGLPSVL